MLLLAKKVVIRKLFPFLSSTKSSGLLRNSPLGVMAIARSSFFHKVYRLFVQFSTVTQISQPLSVLTTIILSFEIFKRFFPVETFANDSHAGARFSEAIKILVYGSSTTLRSGAFAPISFFNHRRLRYSWFFVFFLSLLKIRDSRTLFGQSLSLDRT